GAASSSSVPRLLSPSELERVGLFPPKGVRPMELWDIKGGSGQKFLPGEAAAAERALVRNHPDWMKFIKSAQIELNEGKALPKGVRDHSHFTAEEYQQLVREFINEHIRR